MMDIDELSTLEYDGSSNPASVFNQWYRNNSMDESIIYFRGFLAFYILNEKKGKSRLIHKMQKQVLDMSEQKKIQLTQFRHGKGDYSYIARKVARKIAW